MAEDITKDSIAFNCALKTSKNRDAEQAKLLERFCSIIQIYSDAKK